MALDKEPLQPAQARKLLSQILNAGTAGTVSPTGYFQKRLAERNIGMEDATNVLRRGRMYEQAELENGSWRYRVHHGGTCVVLQFETENKVTLITTWTK